MSFLPEMRGVSLENGTKETRSFSLTTILYSYFENLQELESNNFASKAPIALAVTFTVQWSSLNRDQESRDFGSTPLLLEDEISTKKCTV